MRPPARAVFCTQQGDYFERSQEPSRTLSSRHGQLDYPVVASPADQTISSHGLDHRPVFPEEFRGVVNVWRLHFDAASLSSPLVRYLKMERVAYCLRAFPGRPAFAAHWCPPIRASNRDTLSLRFGFWLGALMAKLVRHRRWIRALSRGEDAKGPKPGHIILIYLVHQFSVNQNFATTVALHQPEVRPSGLVRGSARPPGLAFGSPVKTKQFSLERFVS